LFVRDDDFKRGINERDMRFIPTSGAPGLRHEFRAGFRARVTRKPEFLSGFARRGTLVGFAASVNNQ